MTTMPMRRARGVRLHGMEPSMMLRRDPFADVQELVNRIGGLVQQSVETETERPWIPTAEIEETDDAYVVKLELPGIAADDVEVGVRDRDLCVNGEVREEEEQGSNALRVRIGRFHYHTTLPSDVEADNVEASMNEGVLTLRIPKPQQGQGRRIQITNGHAEGGRQEKKRSGSQRS
ncbi:Hsp20/alpha crystallin family protein [Actinopolymorpha pittospori]